MFATMFIKVRHWRKPEGNRPLVRPRRRCEDNIKIDFGEIGWSGMGWINLAENRDQ
jgi:hypothetical protein